MAIPVRTSLDDIQAICSYLANKATGATLKDAKAVLDPSQLTPQKLSALKFWGFIDENENRLKVTEQGRDYVKKNGSTTSRICGEIIRKIPSYVAVVERAAHRSEDNVPATDVAAHWHEHFKVDTSSSDEVLNEQAVAFFHIAQGAQLGTLIAGRKGAPTRFAFNADALKNFITNTSPTATAEPTTEDDIIEVPPQEKPIVSQPIPTNGKKELGQGIFLAHGKNKKPLEQLKQILEQFKIPCKVAINEPNLGRPISTKVREIMESCNCAILIFTADEEFKDKDGNTIWRPSENVVFELGAAGYLYDRRIVIMKEEGVNFPSNFKDIGYITFEKDALDAKAMDVLKELIGFQIVKVST